MTTKLTVTVTLAAVSLTLAAPVFAEDEVNVTNGFSLDGVPLALRGVDAVALSTLNAVTTGEAAHSVMVEGVAYYFASKISAQKFEAAPQDYMPQYGGFCAFAVGIGKSWMATPAMPTLSMGSSTCL